MRKTFSTIGLLVASLTINSNAIDGDRISQLEKKISEMEARLLKLESLISDSSKTKQVEIENDAWKSIKNWRKLEKDMSPDDVRGILGEPYRIDGGNITSWIYQNRGLLTFYEGKLDHWVEPRQ